MNGQPAPNADNHSAPAPRVCLFEPWAEASANLEGSERLAAFERWLDNDLARLTEQFEDFVTQSSRKTNLGR